MLAHTTMARTKASTASQRMMWRKPFLALWATIITTITAAMARRIKMMYPWSIVM